MGDSSRLNGGIPLRNHRLGLLKITRPISQRRVDPSPQLPVELESARHIAGVVHRRHRLNDMEQAEHRIVGPQVACHRQGLSCAVREINGDEDLAERGPVRNPRIRPHCHDVAACVPKHLLGGASHKQLADPGAAMGAHDDKVGCVVGGGSHDAVERRHCPLPRDGELNRCLLGPARNERARPLDVLLEGCGVLGGSAPVQRVCVHQPQTSPEAQGEASCGAEGVGRAVREVGRVEDAR